MNRRERSFYIEYMIAGGFIIPRDDNKFQDHHGNIFDERHLKRGFVDMFLSLLNEHNRHEIMRRVKDRL